MHLDVIGVGFGRTGTLSLKLALERLGFGPCHHMLEVFAHPEQVAPFLAAADGKAVDWADALAGYRSIVDWPGCAFWRQLVAARPDAKVILTTRDDEAWYESMIRTIFRALGGPELDHLIEPGSVMEMNRRIVAKETFDWRFGDREHVLAVRRAHEQAIRVAIPARCLLEMDVRQGWAPLCAFLGVQRPMEPFPCVNSTGEFLARLPSVLGK